MHLSPNQFVADCSECPRSSHVSQQLVGNILTGPKREKRNQPSTLIQYCTNDAPLVAPTGCSVHYSHSEKVLETQQTDHLLQVASSLRKSGAREKVQGSFRGFNLWGSGWWWWNQLGSKNLQGKFNQSIKCICFEITSSEPKCWTNRHRVQMQRQRDTETQRHRDTEMQRHRDAETQRHRDAEMQRCRDTEMQRHRDAETLLCPDNKLGPWMMVPDGSRQEVELLSAVVTCGR